jgi:hypothetical protein
MCKTAAPASAASNPELAICSGVTGRYGVCSIDKVELEF